VIGRQPAGEVQIRPRNAPGERNTASPPTGNNKGKEDHPATGGGDTEGLQLGCVSWLIAAGRRSEDTATYLARIREDPLRWRRIYVFSQGRMWWGCDNRPTAVVRYRIPSEVASLPGAVRIDDRALPPGHTGLQNGDFVQ